MYSVKLPKTTMNHFQIDLFDNNPDKIINALVAAFCEHNIEKVEQLIQIL